MSGFGKQRKIRLIHKQSLLDYLDRRAKIQSLDWKPGINNPRGYTIVQVIENRELFRLFLGDEEPPLAILMDNSALDRPHHPVAAVARAQILEKDAQLPWWAVEVLSGLEPD